MTKLEVLDVSERSLKDLSDFSVIFSLQRMEMILIIYYFLI
jgi:hypothetical protein